MVEPALSPQRCDTFFGNCVLVPAEVAKLVGNLDPVFAHTFGDIDYGFRATKLGCTIWVAPGYIGECSRNPVGGTWEDHKLPLKQRWEKMRGPKGLPPREWSVILRRQARLLWPLYLAIPYTKFVVGSVFKRS